MRSIARLGHTTRSMPTFYLNLSLRIGDKEMWSRLSTAVHPLLFEEGWVARADGVVSKHQQFLLEFSHHPVRSTKEASRYFVSVAATPPRRGGETLLSPT